jgi:hypothetical protein
MEKSSQSLTLDLPLQPFQPHPAHPQIEWDYQSSSLEH